MNYQWASSRSGFTIVELLIVIVVIGILAAITIVAYNGIQDRANDTAVSNDLANIAKKYELAKVDSTSGAYPFGTPLNDGTVIRTGVSKGSYDVSQNHQLLNCTNTSNPGVDYAVLAMSKSGKRLFISSQSGGVKEYSGSVAWLNASTANICSEVLAGSSPNGAGFSGGVWRVWTNGS